MLLSKIIMVSQHWTRHKRPHYNYKIELTSISEYTKWVKSPYRKTDPQGGSIIGWDERREKWISRLKTKVLGSDVGASGQGTDFVLSL